MSDRETMVEEMEKGFEKKILKSKKPVVVEFTAKWSGASQIMEPIMEDIVKQYQSQIKFYIIDRDSNQYFQEKYDLSVIPTFLIFRDGILIKKVSGIIARDELEGLVKLAGTAS